jgi:hypothetical protein
VCVTPLIGTENRLTISVMRNVLKIVLLTVTVVDRKMCLTWAIHRMRYAANAPKTIELNFV